MYHLVLTPSLGPIAGNTLPLRAKSLLLRHLALPCIAILLRPSRNLARVMQYYFELFFVTIHRGRTAATSSAIPSSCRPVSSNAKSNYFPWPLHALPLRAAPAPVVIPPLLFLKYTQLRQSLEYGSVSNPQGIYSTKSSTLPEASVNRVLPAETEAAKIANLSSMC